MKTLISVVIPTYNRPVELKRAVLSVLSQTYKNFAIIIVNDDEKPINLEINDKRILIVQNERKKGGNGARNTGVIRSKGEYVAFLDDDDEWLPNYLETQFQLIHNSPEEVGLVYSGYLLEEKNRWVKKVQKAEGYLLGNIVTGKFWIGASSNIFVKKKVFNEVGLWDEEMARQQDLEFLVRVFFKFKVLSNQNVTIKIYGHNEPKPDKGFKAREFFFEKIYPYLAHLSSKERNLFVSNHFRRQANYLVKMNQFTMARQYWFKAFKKRKISIRKDGKLLISVLKSQINQN